MDIEQKAIKAVANVAAQAYRRAFDVKPDMTTGALAVMADAIAALDQPTLAPKIDKEYAIWRAIGSLTQRVRDLEQPTPAPEPPKTVTGVSNGKDTIWHDPKASQPLSAAVEAAVNETERMILALHQTNSARDAVIEVFRVLRVRLAALWPQEQVPSVEELLKQARQIADGAVEDIYSNPANLDMVHENIEASFNELRQEYLSRMGQPAKPDKFDCDNCDVTDLRPVQPSPVTAEKLAEWTLDHPVSSYYDRIDYAQAILKAFPTLGRGLTREQIAKAVDKRFFPGHTPTTEPSALGYLIADDLLALQG